MKNEIRFGVLALLLMAAGCAESQPEEDQAFQAVADKSNGLVKVGPKYFAPSCGMFTSNNTTLTGAGASAVAPMLSAV